MWAPGWILNETHNNSPSLPSERVLKLPSASLRQPTFKRRFVQLAHTVIMKLTLLGGLAPPPPPNPYHPSARRGEDRTEVGQSLVERPVPFRGEGGGGWGCNYLITSRLVQGCCLSLSFLDKTSSDFQKNSSCPSQVEGQGDRGAPERLDWLENGGSIAPCDITQEWLQEPRTS